MAISKSILVSCRRCGNNDIRWILAKENPQKGKYVGKYICHNCNYGANEPCLSDNRRMNKAINVWNAHNHLKKKKQSKYVSYRINRRKLIV